MISGFSGTYELKPYQWQGGMFGKQLYEFTNDLGNPLTYADKNGNIIRPDQHQITDMGSVPSTLQYWMPKWFAKDRYLPGFLFHDDSYKNNGWWFACPGGWEFRKITRKQADLYLRQMIIDLGGSAGNATAIYWGVRLGGWRAWGKNEPAK
jgi:hypothetical protein